ncbi:NYN domain-containing protein [Paractinoplanes atraurantiacus]|uniref:NYN domain-containing protein n=1 Tax=Paractinoplanes atraurantiacus TaxID=1036182 RepID=A0A285IHW0_9ACTN|nr:NYN domain-containing protein [Actinoplanes atraurantiacus]
MQVRPKCSLYVDVGYLLSAAAVRVTGTSLRNGIRVDYESLIDELVHQAEKLSELPVLRVHWYDSARDGVPDTQQQAIGELSNVKLRLGRFGVEGQQKGVDLRIGLDLVAHARNGVAEVFILVSGDDDLTEAVEEAQLHGVQVFLLAVPNADDKPHGVSRHLVRAADGLKIVFPDTIDRTVAKVEVSPAAASQGRQPEISGTLKDLAAAEVTDQIESVASRVLTTFLSSASAEELAAVTIGKPSIPRDVDKALLTDLSDRLGVIDLDEAVRHKLRAQFWAQFDEAYGSED